MSEQALTSRAAAQQPRLPGAHDGDPFDLGAVLVIDTAAASAPQRCATDDGCTPTCASSCTSGS
jgi:FxLD family lantipeptide